jgi:hypothetical protein
VRVLLSEWYEMLEEIGPEIGGRRPIVAVLKDEFPYLRDENDVSVRRS